MFVIFSAMQDIESERLERERSLHQKRDELQGIQFQLNATNNHKNQVENNVSRLTDQLYQIRYVPYETTRRACLTIVVFVCVCLVWDFFENLSKPTFKTVWK